MRNRLLGLAAGLALPLVARAQTVYAVTEQARPGQSIALRGDDLGDKTRLTLYPFDANGRRLAGVALRATAEDARVAVARLPATLPVSVYEVVVSGPRGAARGGFVNRARLDWIDVSEAAPGEIVRLVGRNLMPLRSARPSVALHDVATGRAYVASLVQASDVCAKAKLPPALPPGEYRVTLENGLSGPASASPVALALRVVAKGDDPFRLGVAWGREFAPIARNVYNVRTDPRLPVHAAGDGRTDDTEAFRQACALANRTKGTVYAPRGTYRIDDGKGVNVYSDSVLKGDGRGRTILQVGYRKGARDPGWFSPLRFWGGAPLCGIADLTVENLNADDAPNNVMGGSSYGQVTPKSFLKNVEFRLNNGNNLWVGTPDRFVIEDCAIVSTNRRDAPIRLFNANELQVLRTRIEYKAGRATFLYARRSVFEGNTILFNNAARGGPGAVETGGIETSGGQRILVRGNVLGGLNALPKGLAPNAAAWCGEVALAQNTAQDFSFVGMAQASTPTTLATADALPSSSWINLAASSLPREVVTIIGGKGTGQWRWVASHTTRSIVVDLPWQVVPDATSRFSVGSVGCYQQTFASNAISGGSYGISLWNGALDCAVVDNVLTNTGPIVLRSDALPWQGSYWLQPVYDVSVTGNVLKNLDGRRPATISALAFDETGKALGSMVRGVSMRDNRIVGSGYREGWLWLVSDGLEAISVSTNGQRSDPLLHLGTLIEGNAVSGSSNALKVSPTIRLGAFETPTKPVPADKTRRPARAG